MANIIVYICFLVFVGTGGFFIGSIIWSVSTAIQWNIKVRHEEEITSLRLKDPSVEVNWHKYDNDIPRTNVLVTLEREDGERIVIGGNGLNGSFYPYRPLTDHYRVIAWAYVPNVCEDFRDEDKEEDEYVE